MSEFPYFFEGTQPDSSLALVVSLFHSVKIHAMLNLLSDVKLPDL